VATASPGGGGFRFVDLFAGIGGFHVALGGRWGGLGGDCVLTSELDREARRVYRSNFGGPVKGDLRKIIARSKGADVWQDDPEDDVLLGPSELPVHEVLAAGFPCQPFSKSGAQQGLRDATRGTLFFDIASMLERPDPPRFLCLENVRNLAAHDGGRTWQIIVQRLRELGYDVSAEPLIFSPHLLPPELGGAPQFRERVFVLAQHRDFRPSAEGWDFHIPNKPVGDWRPQEDWDLAEWLRVHPALEADLDPYAWGEQRRKRALAWAELLCDLPVGAGAAAAAGVRVAAHPGGGGPSALEAAAQRDQQCLLPGEPPPAGCMAAEAPTRDLEHVRPQAGVAGSGRSKG
jgi:DNA (cytosine-5)-methyltransferase 1